MTADRVADLYALPLDEFTRARNALAKELAEGGDAAAAAEVRALKKASVPAWAVDRVARAHPDEVERLFEVQGLLRDAQKDLIRTGDRGAVREATAEERKAVRTLVDRARAILEGAGHKPNDATMERVADTFYAIAVDEAGRGAVRRGTLTKELKRAGFGDLGGLSVVPPASTPVEFREKKGALQKEAAKLAAAADDAEKRADEAEARAAELWKEADDARARADAAKEKARFARREAAESRRDADRAARRADRQG